jgi:hypothetical protein
MPRSSYAKRTRTARPAAKPEESWVVQVGPEFYNHATTPMSNSLFAFLIRLESYARDKPFLWASNEQIEAKTGLADRTIRELFEEGEAAGWFVRVFQDRSQRNRVGIIMTRRVGPVGLAADTPERVEECRRHLLAGLHLVKDAEPFAFQGDQREPSIQPRRKVAVEVGGFPPSTYGGKPPQKYYHSEKNEVKTAAAPPAEPPPLFSSTTQGEGKGEPDLIFDPVLLAPVLVEVAKVYGTEPEAIRSRVEALARSYEVSWIARAIERVAEINKVEAVGWGLLTKILRDYRNDGGPPPPRKAKTVSRPKYWEEPHRAPVRPKPITLTPQEIEIYGNPPRSAAGQRYDAQMKHLTDSLKNLNSQQSESDLLEHTSQPIAKATEQPRTPLTPEETEARRASILAALKTRRDHTQDT